MFQKSLPCPPDSQEARTSPSNWPSSETRRSPKLRVHSWHHSCATTFIIGADTPGSSFPVWPLIMCALIESCDVERPKPLPVRTPQVTNIQDESKKKSVTTAQRNLHEYTHKRDFFKCPLLRLVQLKVIFKVIYLIRKDNMCSILSLRSLPMAIMVTTITHRIRWRTQKLEKLWAPLE